MLLHLATGYWSEWAWTHLLPRGTVLTGQARQTGHSRCSRITLRRDSRLCDICKIWTLLVLMWALTDFRPGISSPPLSCGSDLSWQPLVSLRNETSWHSCCYSAALFWVGAETLGPSSPSPGGPLLPGGPLGPTVPCKNRQFQYKIYN